LPVLLRLLFRNLLRHKLRTALTLCGICVAILSFGLLRTVISAWYAGVEASSANRLITRNSISLIFPLPLSYLERIRGVEGVKTVSYGNWFGGIYIEEKNFFANLAVEPRTYLELYPEFLLPEDQKQVFLRDRRACIVGRKLAKRFDWKVGDLITLRGTIFPGNWEFVLRGIYSGRDSRVDESQFFFHWDYLNESLKKRNSVMADQVGIYILSVANPEFAAETAARVDRIFRNSYAETLTETEKAFQLGFVALTEAILLVIQLVSFVVIVIIMAVAANSMSMSVRERLGEYAVFKTLGFGGTYLAVMILGESLLIAALGGTGGVLLTFPAAKAFLNYLGDYFPVFVVTKQTVIFQGLAALAVGMAAAVLPTWRAVRVPIIQALGRIG
jgi:putative ABC transport system permease protein